MEYKPKFKDVKTKIFILSAATFLALISCTQTKVDKKNDDQKNDDHWEVKINFNLPKLNPQAIQVCTFDFEPTEKFIQTFNTDYYKEQMKKAKDENEKNKQTSAQIDVTWNFLFHEVTADNLYLLTNSQFYLAQSTNCKQPKTRVWLVSKMFYLSDKPYAYSMPLDVDKGAKLEVTLDSTNLTSLTDLYNKTKQ
jgi:hypothetical protein